MKLIISFFLLVLFLTYCSNQSEPENLDIQQTYIVTDNAGNEKYNFTKNEEFRVKYEIKNNSDKELSFDTSLPVISFTIKKGNQMICSSTDHLDYAAVWLNGKLKVGKSIDSIWEEAPNTVGRKDANDMIVLDPGTYKISVHHSSFFNEFEFPKTSDLTINITE